MPEIVINVINKTAFPKNKNTFMVRDNSDYVIKFILDDEWDDDEVKTARFAYDDEVVDIPFSGNRVNAPIISSGREVKIGLFAGNLSTTTAATLPLVKSIRSSGGDPEDPDGSVYDQIMEKLNGLGSKTIATRKTLGSVKIGDGLSIGEDGTLSANAQDVQIDNQTIIKGEDGKIRTAVGGYVEAIATDVTILNSTVVVDEDDDNEFFEVDNQYDRHLIFPGATYVVTMNGERFVCEGLIYDATENYITWGDDEYYLYEGYYDEDFVWYMQLYAPSGTYNLKIEGDIFGDTHYINNAYINDDIARSDQITDLPFLSAIYRLINTNKTYYKTFDPSVVAVLKQITTITSTSITWDGDKTDKTKLGEFYKIGELPNALNAILAAYGNSTPLIFRCDQGKNVLFTSPTGSGGILIIKTTGGMFSHTVLQYRNNKWGSWSSSLFPEETGIYVSSDIRNVTLETT